MVRLLHIMLFALILSPLAGFPASAQENDVPEKQVPESVARAEKFFGECVANPIVKISEETDLAFCACAATNLQGLLARPEKASASLDFYETAEATQVTSEEMMAAVYAPCLHIQVYEDSYLECMSKNEHKFFVGEPERRDALCMCMAEGDALYFEKYAQPFVEMKHAEGEKVIDLIGEIKRDVDFYHANKANEKLCYYDYTDNLR